MSLEAPLISLHKCGVLKLEHMGSPNASNRSRRRDKCGTGPRSGLFMGTERFPMIAGEDEKKSLLWTGRVR